MSFYYPVNNLPLAGKILVVPVVSAANVSQLAADLLIASLDLKRIGLFDSKYLVSVIGPRDEGDGVTTALELYGRDGVDVVSQKEQFLAALLGFIADSDFSTILFLAGVDVSNRTDEQMAAPTYYLKPSNSPAWDNSPLKTISALQIPAYTTPVPQYPLSPASELPVPFIPGGGLTRRILSALPPAFGTPAAALLQFVAEGDNRTDAAFMAAVTAKVVGLEGKIGEWMQPKSWEEGLFGSPQDQTLYG
ncbi:hypothetical protein K488DRAFT_80053 [Vararia minispora EC-137]|uniref:Uncharacterized protein n=1 Tax=Vararia minispora EC-137 TaxID=1314806 RepID=A0ACB8QDL9_9AGAM|nr:hypothetical protein K488DRAFT_80053 [Vararia minispora EC-137]